MEVEKKGFRIFKVLNLNNWIMSRRLKLKWVWFEDFKFIGYFRFELFFRCLNGEVGYEGLNLYL